MSKDLSKSIPPKWRLGSISQIAQINPIVPVSLLDDHCKVSFLTMADVTESGRITNHQIRFLHQVKSGFTRFEEGDVLFAKITPCMENGKGAFAKRLHNKLGFGSTEFHVLRANDHGDSGFIFQITKSKEVRNKAEIYFSGSAGQQRVASSFFYNYQIPIPPLPQQRKIAKILTTVDNLIEKTEALIAKYQSIKQGMMHDLFTRGVDAKGKLRPAQSEAPELYKQSELGWIPKDWSKQFITELFEKRTEKGRSGLKIMSIVMSGGLVERTSLDRRVDSNLPPEGHALVLKDDIAYNMMRMWQGVFGLALFDCLVSPAYVVLKPKSVIASRFAAQLFSQKKSILKFRQRSQGVVDDRLRLYFKDLKKIPFDIPNSLSEQEKIILKIDSITSLIFNEKILVEKYKTMKTALMQDLLTGKVQVTPDEIDKELAHA